MVGRVQVFEHEHQPLGGRRPPEQPGHAPPELEPGQIGLPARQRRGPQPPAHLRHEASQLRGAVADRFAQLPVVERASHFGQRFQPGPTRRGAAGLPRPPPQHRQPAIAAKGVATPSHDGSRRPRLPDQ